MEGKNMKNVCLFVRRYVQCLLGAVYFFLGGVLKKKHRPLLYSLSLHFGFEKDEKDPNAKPDPTVPEVKLGDLIPDGIHVGLTRLESVSGNVTVTELAVIASLVKLNQPKICFEIGTFDGRTTENMANNQPVDGLCYTLDLPPPEKPADLATGTGLTLASGDESYILKEKSGGRISSSALADKKIIQLYGDSAKYDYSALKGQVDLMFIDGSHSYEYVKSDTEVAWEMVKPGGMILWHDYNSRWWPGVTRALNELHEDARFCAMRNVEGTTLCCMVHP